MTEKELESYNNGYNEGYEKGFKQAQKDLYEFACLVDELQDAMLRVKNVRYMNDIDKKALTGIELHNISVKVAEKVKTICGEYDEY